MRNFILRRLPNKRPEIVFISEFGDIEVQFLLDRNLDAPLIEQLDDNLENCGWKKLTDEEKTYYSLLWL